MNRLRRLAPALRRSVSTALLAFATGALVFRSTPVAAADCVLDFMDRRYELHEVSASNGFVPSLGRLNNAGRDTAAAGDFAFLVPFVFNIEGGRTAVLPSGLSEQLFFATASDLSADGVLIGSIDPLPGTEIAEEIGSQDRQIYTYDAVRGFRLLRDSNGFVASFQGSASGLSVNASGQMTVSGFDGSQQNVWLLSPGGTPSALRAPDSTDCRDFELNESGGIPPPGTLATGLDPFDTPSERCSRYNTSISDAGGFAGYDVEVAGNFFDTTAPESRFLTRDGSRVPGGDGYAATSVNSQGFVAAEVAPLNGSRFGRPAGVFGPDDTFHDLSGAIVAQCDLDALAYEYTADSTIPVFINDDFYLAYGSAMLRPGQGEISYAVQGVSGLGLIGGNAAARVGTTFVTETTVTNTGTAAIEGLALTFDTGEPYFETISGPQPNAPARLEPGESWIAQFEFDALEVGQWTGAARVTGLDENGNGIDFESSPSSLIVYDGEVSVSLATFGDSFDVGTGFPVTVTVASVGAEALDVQFDGAIIVATPDEIAALSPSSETPAAFELAPGQSRNFQAQIDARAQGDVTLSTRVIAFASDGTDFSATSERVVEVAGDPMSAEIEPAEPQVLIGEIFDVELRVTNDSSEDLSAVLPPAALDFGGISGAAVREGPIPTSAASLAPGESTVFVYTVDTVEAEEGNLTVGAVVSATDAQGENVEATARCGFAAELAADGRRTPTGQCSGNGDSLVQVKKCRLEVSAIPMYVPYAAETVEFEPVGNDNYPPGAT